MTFFDEAVTAFFFEAVIAREVFFIMTFFAFAVFIGFFFARTFFFETARVTFFFMTFFVFFLAIGFFFIVRFFMGGWGKAASQATPACDGPQIDEKMATERRKPIHQARRVANAGNWLFDQFVLSSLFSMPVPERPLDGRPSLLRDPKASPDEANDAARAVVGRLSGEATKKLGTINVPPPCANQEESPYDRIEGSWG